ncbi:hypothetical protein [Sabulibacter ruber]|uniref:hypothetical protein n=1 Tax=Sabulibacter ruber TaxID=2811901 RepID=UPI001A979AFE|nr:hypothetical protein [Sabulibacter ruber]
METLTKPNLFGPAPVGKGNRSTFFGAVFAGLLVLFLAGALYFFHLTDFSSPQVAPAQGIENPVTTGQGTRVGEPVAGPSIGTTADMASHAMFAPLQERQANAVPLILR